MLCAIDEGYGHLVGVALPQLWIAIDINYGILFTGLGTDSRNVANCLIAEVATLPCQYNYPLGPFGELDHITIFHDAGDATSEARRVRRPNRVMANRTAPPTRDSTETSRTTP
jgi:hypothetical protein